MRNRRPNCTGGFKTRKLQEKVGGGGGKVKGKGHGKGKAAAWSRPLDQSGIEPLGGLHSSPEGGVHVTINRSIIDWIRSTEYGVH